MKIKRLNLAAFGPFSDYELDFEQNGAFSLVYGLNEAGKTTVLRAIRDFFYGIPQRSPDAYLHPPARLRIEAVLEDRNGREFQLVRRKGAKNTLLDGVGNVLDEAFLQQFLGSISREAFTLMFGLDHRGLRRGGEELLKGRGALGEALFEAAAGIGSLRELFLELEKEAAELFKPSGSRPPLNAGIERYLGIRRKITELSLEPGKWEELERKYFQQEQQLQALTERERELVKKKAHLERLKNTLPLLARRRRYLEEREALGEIPPLPSSFKEERLELANKRRAAASLKKRLEAEMGELKEEKARIRVPQELLEHGEVISALQERLDTYRNYVKEIFTLQGEMQELQEGALSLLHRINPSLSRLEEAASLSIPSVLVQEIKQLSLSYPQLRSNYSSAKKQVRELTHALERQKKEKEKSGLPRDGTELLRALQRAGKKGEPEQQLKEIRSLAHTLERELERRKSSLPLWSGSLEELPGLPLPLAATVRSYEQRFRELEGLLGKVEEKLAEERQKLAADEEQLAGAGLEGELPTPELLEAARERRQHGWHLVRRAWLEGRRDEEEEREFSAGQPLEVAYELSVVRADEIADRLRYEAKQVERMALLLSEMEKRRQKIEELEQQKERRAQEKGEMEKSWSEIWKGTGITPLSPSEMLAWLEQCREIMDGINRLEAYRRQEQELEQLITEHREEIALQLVRLGEPGPGEGESLEMLLERAQDVYKDCQAAAGKWESMEAVCRQTEENLTASRREEEEAKRSLEAWEKRWFEVLKKAGLEAGLSPETVRSYLEMLESLLQKKEEIFKRQATLDKMEKYTVDFTSRLRVLQEKLAPDLAGLPADYAVSQLQTRFSKAVQDQNKLEDLNRQLEKAEATYREAERDFQEAHSRLAELVRQARCQSEEELPAREEKAARLAELQKSLTGLEEDLLSLSGGLSLEAIIAEAAGVDGDAVSGELEEVEQALKAAREERDALQQIFGVTRKEYREKVEGTSLEAAEAAEEAQGVLAGLKVQAEEYLRLRLASLVLRRGIERYREENQSPVIRQAGRLFARLTRGSFAGLKIDFDEKDNPVLLGLRPSGEGVAVDGMSDGTLDQLYLSLRLASLERYLEHSEPLPFILDDLLVNFDRLRAAETLKVLGEFASKTQVLFFTHHESFVELARETLPLKGIITLA